MALAGPLPRAIALRISSVAVRQMPSSIGRVEFSMKKSAVCNTKPDRKSTRLNSSHTVIYTLSLHDALPISRDRLENIERGGEADALVDRQGRILDEEIGRMQHEARSEEHTSELQSHSDLHSFPTRRSSDLARSP